MPEARWKLARCGASGLTAIPAFPCRRHGGRPFTLRGGGNRLRREILERGSVPTLRIGLISDVPPARKLSGHKI